MAMLRRVLVFVACCTPLLARAAEEAAQAPAQRPMPAAPGAGQALEVAVALVVVLAAIGLMAWLVRRMAHGGYVAGGAIRVLGGVSVGQRERVVLIQAGETQLLLGVAPGRVQTLHVLDKPVTPPAVDRAPGSESFAARLAVALKKEGKG